MKTYRQNRQENCNNNSHKKDIVSHRFDFGENSWLTYKHLILSEYMTEPGLEGYFKGDCYTIKYNASTEQVPRDFYNQTIWFLSRNKLDFKFNPYSSRTEKVILYYNKDDFKFKKFRVSENNKLCRYDKDCNRIKFKKLYDKRVPPIIFNKMMLLKHYKEISEIRLVLETLQKAFIVSFSTAVNDFLNSDFVLQTNCYVQDQLKYIAMIWFFNAVHHFMHNNILKRHIIMAHKENVPPSIDKYYMENISINYRRDCKDKGFGDDMEYDYTFLDHGDKKLEVIFKFDYEEQILHIYPYVKLFDGLSYLKRKEYLEKLGNPVFDEYCLLGNPAKIGAYLSFEDDELVLNVGGRPILPLYA